MKWDLTLCNSDYKRYVLPVPWIVHGSFSKWDAKLSTVFFVQRWTFLGLSFTDNLADILYSFSPLSTGSAAGDQNSIPSFQVVLSWMIVQCFLETVFNSQILKIFSNELKKNQPILSYQLKCITVFVLNELMCSRVPDGTAQTKFSEEIMML